MKKGFTLVELVIVIVIVGILSIVAVPIYKGYVEKAKLTEGKALVGSIRTAQNIYFAEHGTVYKTGGIVSYSDVLSIDARSNKYYKRFDSGIDPNPQIAIAIAYDDSNQNIGLYWALDPELKTVMGRRMPVYWWDDESGARQFSNS